MKEVLEVLDRLAETLRQERTRVEQSSFQPASNKQDYDLGFDRGYDIGEMSALSFAVKEINKMRYEIETGEQSQ